MKRNNPIVTYNEKRKILSLEKKVDKIDVRIGRYYSNLEEYQKKRFDRLVGSLARRYDIALNQSPMEMILIRQIALNTIRIEEAELYLVKNPDQQWSTDVEKWLFLSQKERREAINLLSTLVQAGSKQDKAASFDSIRNILRTEEGLKESKTEIKETGYQKRYYDKASTQKPE